HTATHARRHSSRAASAWTWRASTFRREDIVNSEDHCHGFYCGLDYLRLYPQRFNYIHLQHVGCLSCLGVNSEPDVLKGVVFGFEIDEYVYRVDACVLCNRDRYRFKCLSESCDSKLLPASNLDRVFSQALGQLDLWSTATRYYLAILNRISNN